MQYDSPISSETFQTSLTSTNFSSATAAAISSLLSLETTETVNLASWDGVSAPLTPTGQTAAAEVVTGTIAGRTGDTVNLAIPDSLASAKAFVLDSNANLNVTFNPVVAAAAAADASTVNAFSIAAAAVAADPATAVEFLVKTGNGDDIITVTGDQNTYIDAGFGNDIITTGNGNNTVVAGLGNNVITTGTGNDTIVLSGVNHSDVVNTGAGYDVVQLDGSSANYSFVAGNNFNVTLNGAQGLGQTAAITDAEFLSFTDSEGVLSTVALAHNDAEAVALRLYEGILGRDADVTGAQQWTTQVNAGTSVNTIAENFLNSAEYTDADNTAFIDTLYTTLLGRGIGEDTAGAQNWLSVLANGGSLVDVVTGIATSQEAIAQDSSNGEFVEALYQAALERTADADGLSSWVGQLVNGASRAEVAAGILGSSEAAEKSTDNFLNDLYVKALGRTEEQAAADVTGKAGWVEALANGATHADVAIGIIGSQEAIAHIDNVVVLHGAV